MLPREAGWSSDDDGRRGVAAPRCEPIALRACRPPGRGEGRADPVALDRRRVTPVAVVGVEVTMVPAARTVRRASRSPGPRRDPAGVLEPVQGRMDDPRAADQGGVGIGRERERGSILYGRRPEPPRSAHRAGGEIAPVSPRSTASTSPPGSVSRDESPAAGTGERDMPGSQPRSPSSRRRSTWVERPGLRRLTGISVTRGSGDRVRTVTPYLGDASKLRRSSAVRVSPCGRGVAHRADA